jgi:hypothetical protein
LVFKREKIAFSSRRLIGSNEWWQLYVIDEDGTNEIQITSGNQHSVRPAWQPARVFADRMWLPKWFPEASAPGKNNFTAGNVSVNDDGLLNLRIDFSEGKWTSAEIISKDSFGYGKYSLVMWIAN